MASGLLKLWCLGHGMEYSEEKRLGKSLDCCGTDKWVGIFEKEKLDVLNFQLKAWVEMRWPPRSLVSLCCWAAMTEDRVIPLSLIVSRHRKRVKFQNGRVFVWS